MYSLKKTMLNILIGIAAAGVATADDTSSDASVSLSLSLTNVVPSNKAGKQPKAGKQVKATVGKAVKAKAFKDVLSLSSSMSYGPDEDPDSSPDFDPGLQTGPPDQESGKAQLFFSVTATSDAFEGQYIDYDFVFEPIVFVTAIAEKLVSYIIDDAVAVALGDNKIRIERQDVIKAVKKDAELSSVLIEALEVDVIEDDILADYTLNSGLYTVFQQQTSVPNISQNGMSLLRSSVRYILLKIMDEAVELATSNNSNLTVDLAKEAYLGWIDESSGLGDGRLLAAQYFATDALSRYLESS